MIACYKKHYKIAKYLLGLGADVNRKSVKGNTALHDCAESGSLEILQMLINNGAKMDVDSYGKGAFDFGRNRWKPAKRIDTTIINERRSAFPGPVKTGMPR